MARKRAKPSAAIFDSRTLQRATESGARAECNTKRRRRSKTHTAVDTLGNLLALLVIPTNEQDLASIGASAEKIRR